MNSIVHRFEMNQHNMVKYIGQYDLRKKYQIDWRKKEQQYS